MNLLRLILTPLILMGVVACATLTPSAPPEERAVAPTAEVASISPVLPTSTAMTLVTSTPMPLVTSTAMTLPPAPGYPEPPIYPTYPPSYPEPPVFPTGYPEPAESPTPAPPTETPEPLPMVDMLPLTWTWFTAYSDSNGSDSNGRCDYLLFARSPEGEIVQFKQRISGVVARPEATPLLFTCTPIGDEYRNLEIRAVDIEAGTSVLFPINTVESSYYLTSAILSPDARYILFGGGPGYNWDGSDPEQFWGLYRADLSSGEMVQFISFSRDPEGAYEEAGIGWDLHLPTLWDETGLVVFTMASGDRDLWLFTWDEDAPLPYSVDAGTLAVELLDSNASWPQGIRDSYDEPSLPARFQSPTLIYEPPS